MPLPIAGSRSCLYLGETQQMLEQAIREAFNAGAVYGMSRSTTQVTLVAPGDVQRQMPLPDHLWDQSLRRYQG